MSTSTIYTPPATLSKPAQKLWRSLAVTYGIVDPGGQLLLNTALAAWDRCEQACAAIKRDGPTVKDRYGCPKAHPMLAVERTARTQLLHALAALRLDVEPLRTPGGQPRA